MHAMASFVRTKRVTGPLGDKVRDQLIGKEVPVPVPDFAYVTSGSEYSSDGYGDSSSCLSDLVYGFLEPAGEIIFSGDNDSVESELNDSVSDHAESTLSLLRAAANDPDPFRAQLISDVSAALCESQSSFSDIDSSRPFLRRRVMAFLRNLGHDAAICKTKWPSSSNVTAGNYQFIDVVESNHFPQTRYIIDLDFAGQFEIARPSDRYSRLLQSIPTLYVGRAEDLKQVVDAVCGEARRSLKSRGLHLPPWRKNGCMQNKWFGPCRRTINPTPNTVDTLSHSAPLAVKCRSIGFDEAVSTDVNERFWVAATSLAR